MSTTKSAPPAHEWTAAELRQMPPEQRDVVLASAAAAADADYQNDPALTGFEAFGEKDLHADSSDSRSR